MDRYRNHQELISGGQSNRKEKEHRDGLTCREADCNEAYRSEGAGLLIAEHKGVEPRQAASAGFMVPGYLCYFLKSSRTIACVIWISLLSVESGTFFLSSLYLLFFISETMCPLVIDPDSTLL